MTTALWLDGAAKGLRLERAPLNGGHDERWLQGLLFEHPELIPLDMTEPGIGPVIPICRELALPKPGGSVFLDMFGITASGRPVLVECKLWRNPQARREVVAQILEYAALLRRWSYADLTTRLRPILGSGDNPLFGHVQSHDSELDEARFVDAVTRNLRSGASTSSSPATVFVKISRPSPSTCATKVPGWRSSKSNSRLTAQVALSSFRRCRCGQR